MYFYHMIFFLNFSQTLTISLSFPFNSPSPACGADYSCMALLWSVLHTSGVTPLKKTSSNPMPAVSRSRTWCLSPLLHAGILSVLIWLQSCAHCHDHCEFICASALLYPESTESSESPAISLIDPWDSGGLPEHLWHYCTSRHTLPDRLLMQIVGFTTRWDSWLLFSSSWVHSTHQCSESHQQGGNF